MKYSSISCCFIAVFLAAQSHHPVSAKLGESLATNAEHEKNDKELPELKLVRDEAETRRLQQTPELTFHGGNPGSDRIPLGLCEGDCDEDSDCAEGLKCFQRDANDPVPGCAGNDRSRSDYCVLDMDALPQPTNNPTNPPTNRPTNAPTNPPTNRPTNPPTNRPTDSPIPVPTALPPTIPARNSETVAIDIVGNNGFPASKFPLGMCEGDCDSDEECGEGLICFFRSAAVPVPGCSGGEADTTGSDYCIADPNLRNPRPTQPTGTGPSLADQYAPLEIVGNNGFPASKFPLGVCEGDCDTDDDCAPGLKCFLRNRGDPVPGCYGDLSRGGDYCVVDPNAPKPTNNPTNPPTMKPTNRPTNQPTNKPTPAPVPPPTNPPTDRPTGAPRTIPPVEPQYTIEGEVDVAGNNGSPSNVFPLGLCEGDCDDDDECAPGLVCFQRDPNEPVPGCSGGLDDSSRTDYCIRDPKTLTPPPTDRPTNSPTKAPTNAPTKRPTPAPTPNPTNFPTPRPTPQPVSGPTVEPSAYPTAVPTTATPTTLVPTLRPSTSPTRAPEPTPAPSPEPLPEPYHNTRLRLYWEEGYTWQESTRESFWCMMYDYRGQPGTGRCWYGDKSGPCTRDELFIARCNDDKRQRFSIIFIDDNEVMFKVSRDNRCFQRNGQKIQLRECDPSNDLQRWYAQRGRFFQRRFEISNVALPDYCATQAHHPKPGEVVELEPCVLPRHPFHQTHFWQRW